MRFPGQFTGSGWLYCDPNFVKNSAKSFLMLTVHEQEGKKIYDIKKSNVT